MTRRWKRVALLVGCGIALQLVLVFFPIPFFPRGITQVAHESVQYELHAIAQSIYEYHAETGQWPGGIDDLGQTPLGARLRYWKPTVQNGSIVVVWHDHLSAKPSDNRDVVLAYHNRGLLAEMGHQWVCWGDLRTEYISSKRLREVLHAR